MALRSAFRSLFAATAAVAIHVVVHAQAASAVAPSRIDWAKGGLGCQLHPEYPVAALRAQATGDTTLHVHVDADDRIIDVHVLRPSGPTREHALMDDAAATSVAQCRFARAPGTPAADQWAVITFRWRLEDGGKVLQAPEADLDNLRNAAAHGDASAAFSFYMRAPYTPQYVEESLRWLRYAADKDRSGAEYELGRLYSLGEGVPLDLAQTVAWWERASAQHDLRTTLRLAHLLLDDASGQRNPARAVELLKQAAVDHSAAAMVQLGDLAAAGTGMARDDAVALVWWRRAAQEGQSGAAFVRLGDVAALGRQAPDAVLAATDYLIARRLFESTANARLDALHADADVMKQAQAKAERWNQGGRRSLPE